MTTRIDRAVLRAMLLFGLMGFTAVSALASGAGTKPDPDVPPSLLFAAK